MIRLLAVLLLGTVPVTALDHAHFVELNKQARGYANKQDWKSLRASLLEIGKELPISTPTYMLRMASVEVHLGNNKEALAWMTRYAATGLTYDVTKDDDLKPLAGDQEFQSIATRMQANAKPVSHADLFCTLPQADLMPEDLTYDPASKTFIVSSIQHHTVYRVVPPKSGKECTLQQIPLEENSQHWPTTAVSMDSRRKVLWVATAAFPDFEDVPKQEQGKTALLAVNPINGKVIKRFDLGLKAPAVFGDMFVASDGTVYVTDSLGGGVYRLRGDLDSAKLEKIADGLFSPQTPALAHDGKRLFVADYSIGVAVVELATGKVDYLPHPENLAVTGLDGLCMAGDSLIGIQNGTDPERIIRLHLNPEQSAITSLEIIEQSTERLGEPTHAILVGDTVYTTGNVGWGKINDHGKLKPGEQFTNPILLRFPAK